MKRAKEVLNIIVKPTLIRSKHLICIYIIISMFAFQIISHVAQIIFTKSGSKAILTRNVLENLFVIFVCLNFVFIHRYLNRGFTLVREMIGIALVVVIAFSLTEHHKHDIDNSNIFLFTYGAIANLSTLIFFETIPCTLRSLVYQIAIFTYYAGSTMLRPTKNSILNFYVEIEFYMVVFMITFGILLATFNLRYYNYKYQLTSEKTINSWKKVMNISGIGISIEKERIIMYRNDLLSSILPNLNDQLCSEYYSQSHDDANSHISYKADNILYNGIYSTIYTVHDNSQIHKKEQQKYLHLLLATITHELRTPLNIITAILGFIKEQSSNTLILEEISKALCASTMQENLINDIIDIAKINSDQFQIHRYPTDIKKTIRTLFDLFKSNINNAINFQLIISPNTPSLIMIDEKRYKQVVLNLLSNSAKFTSAGYIKIKIDYLNHNLLTSISDSGVGISAKDNGKIFHQFGMVEKSKSLNKSGTGLGLNLCKKLVERMEGQIDFTSIENINTEFKFKIRAEEANQIKVSQIVKPKVPMILIVDDNILNLYLMQNYAKKFGVRWISFQSSVDMISKLPSLELEPNCAAFIDLNMPNVDGYMICSKMRASFSDIKLIALTGEDKALVLNKCIECGFNDIIEKPISFEAFSQYLI